ncbi:MAG: O-antigen ligase family protein, partial [Defluviitaleaceae bacterium]|nr:O-antigen ligase family protein [Defluviitaleaceae bacterium]
QRITGNFGMTASWIDTGMFGTVDRIYSTLENPNVLGGYLIFIVIISFAMIYYYKDAWHKLFALGIFGAAGLCVVFTHSRGAWLGLLVAAGLFALIRERRLIFLGVLGLIVAPFIIPPEILMRFLSIGDMADTSTSYRVSIWLGSVDMIQVFWPSGIGQGVENFNFVYNLFALSAAFTQHTHMLYLQIMVYWGIAGIGMFLLIMGGLFKNLIHAITNSDNAIKTLGAALFAAMAGYMVKAFTDNVWYNFRIFAFFWVIVALGIALANISKQGSVQNGE